MYNTFILFQRLTIELRFRPKPRPIWCLCGLLILSKASNASSCQNGWTRSKISSSCLKVVDEKKTWEEARKVCKTKSAYLLKISNYSMGGFVSTLVPAGVPAFIGLIQNGTTGKMKWVNDVQKMYANFAQFPKSDKNSVWCAELNHPSVARGRWRLINCSSSEEFLCEKDLAAETENITCDFGWIFVTAAQKCMKLFHDRQSWLAAQQTCYSEFGDLATIRWPTVNSEIMEFVIGTLAAPVYIGLRAFNNRLQWSSETKKENNSTTSENLCGLLNSKRVATGQWILSNCTSHHSFVCEKAEECQDQTYGVNCSKRCSVNCAGDKSCDKVHGSCTMGCTAGYEGPLCNRACRMFTYGANCSKKCSSNCAGDKACDKVVGTCPMGCTAGFEGPSCTKECDMYVYGANCLKRCSTNCAGDASCDKKHGTCTMGCAAGYKGLLCTTECQQRTFGVNCFNKCSDYCAGKNKTCDKVSGLCLEGCVGGFEGDFCALKKSPGDYSTALFRNILFMATMLASSCVILITPFFFPMCLIQRVFKKSDKGRPSASESRKMEPKTSTSIMSTMEVRRSQLLHMDHHLEGPALDEYRSVMIKVAGSDDSCLSHETSID